jgi:ArsR family transcriptional regulator
LNRFAQPLLVRNVHGNEWRGDTTLATPMTEPNDSTGSGQRNSVPARHSEPGLVVPADATIDDLVQLFKLLADDTRLRILSFLQQTGELNVRELCRLLRQRQPSVSHHLALLRGAGLIDMRREGKHNFYRLVPARLEQLVTTYFGGSPGHPASICFDGFKLRYAPSDTASPLEGERTSPENQLIV